MWQVLGQRLATKQHTAAVNRPALSRCLTIVVMRRSAWLDSVSVALFPVVLILLFLSPSVHSASTAFKPTFTNTELKRHVDLATHVEEVSLFVKATNSGPSPASQYIVAVPSVKAGQLSFVEALTGGTPSATNSATFVRLSKPEESKNRLVTSEVQLSGVDIPAATGLTASNVTYFAVAFPTPVQPSASISFTVFMAFTRTLTPLPSHKLQDDNQLVLYHDNVYVLSPYPSSNQRSTFKLQSSHIESYTRKHASVSSDQIEYGPFTDTLPAFSHQPLAIHYQNNAPFITMLSMRKEVEVSQWGNVAITEWYEMKHTGAELTGPFSRFDYQRQMGQAPASFNFLRASLPVSAEGIYYRDYIGNVSTSRVRKSKQETVMEVQPRFPMFGGWKAEFEIGYNLPASHYLSVIDQYDDSDTVQQGDYLLGVPFGSMFPAAATDNATVRIILPEGSSAIQWSTPFSIDSADDTGLHFTHLDTTGRPVLTLSKSNVVRFHNQRLTVSYAFRNVYMLREPLLVISAVMAFFAVAMVYYRVELGVHSETKVD